MFNVAFVLLEHYRKDNKDALLLIPPSCEGLVASFGLKKNEDYIVETELRTLDKKINLIAIEPSACPSLTKGKYAYDFGDTGMMTPLTKMHTLGSQFVPSGFHAGGLRYHGMAPIVSHLVNEGFINPETYT